MATDEERLVVSLEARINQFEKSFQRANKTASSNFDAIEKRAKESASRLDKAFANVGNGIRNTVAGIGAAFAGIVSAKAAGDLIDSSIKIQNQLKTTGLEGKELKSVYDQLFASAQKNATPLEALVTLYSRTSGAAKDLGASQAQMLKFTDGVSLAMRVSGQSAGESAGALLQLSQALGDGKIQAEEYNSLLDAGRPILQAVASGMADAGGSISKLTQLVKDGKVSSAAFFNAFLAGLPTLQSQVANSEGTISSSFVRLQNVLVDAAKRFNESSEASQQFSSIVDQVAAEIQSVNFDTLVKQIEAVAKAFSDGIATANNWAAAIGRASGLSRVGKALVNALPGDTTVKSYLGGALQVSSGDAVQDRINDAFDGPAPNTGGLTAEQIQAFATRSGAAAGAAAAKASRLPAAETVKPVSLADYPVPASSGGGKGGGGGRSRDDYAREIEQLKERTNSLQASTAAQAALNPLVDDYGAALATAEAKQQLMNAAQKQNKAVTPEMSAQIDAAAEAYGRATAAAQQLQDKQDDVKRSAEDALGTARDVTKGLITDLASGKGGAEALSDALAKIGDAILDNVLDKLFTLKNFSGIFGGLLGGNSAAALNSSIGFTGVTTTLGAFLGLAGGGHVRGPGTSTSDDIPAMLSDGEFVVNADATRRNRAALEAINAGRTPTLPAVSPAITRGAASRGGDVNFGDIKVSVTTQGSSGDPAKDQQNAKNIAKQLSESLKQEMGSYLTDQLRPGGLLYGKR